MSRDTTMNTTDEQRFPERAGMSPADPGLRRGGPGFPRTRGDETVKREAARGLY